MKRTILIFISMLFCVFCIAPLNPVYANEYDDVLAWQNVFASRTDYQSANLDRRPNTPPDSYIVSGVPATYTYCFCAGRCENGVAFFTDSDILIATGGGLHDRVFFSVPSGKHIQSASFRIQDGSTIWSLSTTNVIFCGATSPEYFGNVIFRNDCSILNSVGDELSPPIIDENFRFSLSAWSDYSLRGFADTNTENEFRVEFYISPTPSGSADLVCDGIFDLISQLSEAYTNHDDTAEERLKSALREQYPLVFQLVEEGSTEFELVSNEIYSSLHPVSPLTDGIEYSVNLLQTYNNIVTRSYNGYRGFGGRYIGTTGADFNINVINFYANVRNSPAYTDLNTVYAVFYTASESEAPVCILKQNFRVSDFFPDSLHIPDMTLPDSDVIDGISPYPDGGSSDWSVFQHAMYMRYLLDQLNRDISISLSNSFTDLGDSLKLPDYEFDTDIYPLTPFDMSLPDTSLPEMGGVPVELSKPFQAYGLFGTDFLNSTGFMSILSWICLASLAAWFIWGRRK